MEEETKLETPEEKTHRKERERFMRQAITQAKKAEKLMEVPIEIGRASCRERV